MRIYALLTAVGLSIAGLAAAAETGKAPAACTEVQTCGAADCCAHCGSCCPCEKHCRVVCTVKEVKKTVWVVKCGEFCAPLPQCGRKCGGDGCGTCEAAKASCAEPNCGCDGCGKKCDPCAAENSKCYVPPKCGKVRQRKILEKKEIICKVLVYKCEVVYGCPSCGCGECGDHQPAPPAGKSPTTAPAPAPAKRVEIAPLPPVAGASFVE